MFFWTGAATAAPVAEPHSPEPEAPAVVPWSNARPTHPVEPLMNGTPAGGASAPVAVESPPVPVEVSSGSGEMPEVVVASGVDSGGGAVPQIPAAARLEASGAILPVDRNDDYLIEAVAIGMIAAGATVGVAAWVRLRRQMRTRH